MQLCIFTAPLAPRGSNLETFPFPGIKFYLATEAIVMLSTDPKELMVIETRLAQGPDANKSLLPTYTSTIVSRSQTLSQGKGGGGRGGRESGKVLYIELSQRLVRGATNQIASLVLRWHIRL